MFGINASTVDSVTSDDKIFDAANNVFITSSTLEPMDEALKGVLQKFLTPNLEVGNERGVDVALGQVRLMIRDVGVIGSSNDSSATLAELDIGDGELVEAELGGVASGTPVHGHGCESSGFVIEGEFNVVAFDAFREYQASNLLRNIASPVNVRDRFDLMSIRTLFCDGEKLVKAVLEELGVARQTFKGFDVEGGILEDFDVGGDFSGGEFWFGQLAKLSLFHGLGEDRLDISFRDRLFSKGGLLFVLNGLGDQLEGIVGWLKGLEEAEGIWVDLVALGQGFLNGASKLSGHQ